MDSEERVKNLISGLENFESVRRLEQFYCNTHKSGHAGGPYDFQVEFHNAGAVNPERMMMTANRVGKTRSAAAEVAIQSTGIYPNKWWKGRRFRGPGDWIVAGQTNELTRDICQLALFGPIEGGKITGTGWIPADRIGEYSFRNCGVRNVLDYVKVRHQEGKWSVIYLKSFEQGPDKFQGTSKTGIWLDEEPDLKVYSECQTRLLDTKGMMLFTRTPMWGLTPLVLHYMNGGPGIYTVHATWDDAPHLDPAERQRLLMSYPEHERETRSKGTPMMGSGGVYSVLDEEISCDPFEIPAYFRRICGIDFGIDHPGAAAWLAHDPDADIVYLTHCYRARDKTALYHAHAINSKGLWIPVAWPHDGMVRDKGSGKALKDQFRGHGVNMLPFSARYDDDKGGGQGTEPVVLETLERMRTGRFKAFRNLPEYFEEKRMYHRVNGLIVKINDDILSAKHTAMMSLRFARTDSSSFNRPLRVENTHDPLGKYRHR